MSAPTPWLLRIDGDDVAWFPSRLSSEERLALGAIRSPRRRAEYAAGRILAKFAGASAKGTRALAPCWRMLASGDLRRKSESLDLSAYAVVASRARSGPPRLYDRAAQRYDDGLSISHRWPFVAVTYGPDRRCGIDIERIGSVSAEVAAYFLPESATLSPTLPVLASGERNTLLWTIKEATFKALRVPPGDCGVQDVHITDLRVMHRSQDGRVFALTSCMRVAGVAVAAQIRALRIGRLFCSEARL
ncbi:MAG TPA: 4'-phosphopantetheinyl transferase superfamily protein [Candidatus Acidoferrales bacterium]|nr:4'-phosphopantetheinyl transferase superfamily protein [Candidatus Acidoferrales bacterium]